MPFAYDPELEPVMKPLQAMKAAAPPVAVHDVATRRETSVVLLQMLANIPLAPGVKMTEYTTQTPDDHTIKMVWYWPDSASTTTPGPAILHIHGGGMILFDVHAFHPVLNNQVALTGVPTLSVDYRLAPEHPDPTPLEDCYTALLWLHAHASELHIDPTRIAVKGESAGGGLAAGTALMARDRKLNPPLAKQILVYPMIDDRNTTPVEELLPFLVWSYEDNLTGWAAYVGKENRGTDKVSKYAAPARETDLAGLPDAFIDVGTLDIFMSEDMEYARKMAEAGVGVEFHLYSGAPHGFEGFVPDSTVSKAAMEARFRAMKSF